MLKIKLNHTVSAGGDLAGEAVLRKLKSVYVLIKHTLCQNAVQPFSDSAQKYGNGVELY